MCAVWQLSYDHCRTTPHPSITNSSQGVDSLFLHQTDQVAEAMTSRLLGELHNGLVAIQGATLHPQSTAPTSTSATASTTHDKAGLTASGGDNTSAAPNTNGGTALSAPGLDQNMDADMFICTVVLRCKDMVEDTDEDDIQEILSPQVVDILSYHYIPRRRLLRFEAVKATIARAVVACAQAEHKKRTQFSDYGRVQSTAYGKLKTPILSIYSADPLQSDSTNDFGAGARKCQPLDSTASHADIYEFFPMLQEVREAGAAIDIWLKSITSFKIFVLDAHLTYGEPEDGGDDETLVQEVDENFSEYTANKYDKWVAWIAPHMLAGTATFCNGGHPVLKIVVEVD
jgi:hypothetical protein